ncbi:MAG TPA: replication-relaxation family protein [Patescibacteria group bacterium]|nr:replication-relaxation family protein [Patescibacteria group bacterium]
MTGTPLRRQRLGRLGFIALHDYLSDRDIAIVRAVYVCRLMSTIHIQRLFFNNNAKRTGARMCRRVLQRLADEEVLRRRERRIGGVRAGSASFIYGLGPVGARVVSEKRLHYYTSDPSDYFLDHTLALADLYVSLHERARAGAIELLEIQTEPRCWRTFTTLEAGRLQLKPDMFARIASQTEEMSYFIEMDRGTTYKTALLKKLKIYEQYYVTNKEQQSTGIFPQVLWIAPDEKRAKTIRQATEAINQKIPGICAITTSDHAVRLISGLEPP